MAWIKRNVWLVVSILVSILALGASSFYLYKKYQDKNVAEAEFADATQELGRLQSRRVFPKESNVSAVARDYDRLKEEYDRIAGRFDKIEIPANLSGATFKLTLENMLYQLHKEADKAGVTLPANDYAFTFKTQRTKVDFDEADLLPLTLQLKAVNDLVRTLFSSRIHALAAIRRSSVSTNETTSTGPGTDYLSQTVETNGLTGAVVLPFEVALKCFTPELDDLLNKLVESPKAYIVKNISIQPDLSGPPGGQGGSGMTTPQSPSGGMDRGMMERYGLAPPGGGNAGGMDRGMMERYGLGGGESPGMSSQQSQANRYNLPTPGGNPYSRGTPGISSGGIPRGPQTILNENPLQVILKLQLVTFPPPPPVEGQSGQNTASNAP